MIALVLIVLLIAFGAVTSIWMLIAAPGWMNGRFLFDVLIRLAMVALCLSVVVGIARRRGWGRLLGLLVLVGFTVITLVMPDTTQYDNDAQRGGGAFTRLILVPLLMGLWGYRFGFSAKAKRYFGS